MTTNNGTADRSYILDNYLQTSGWFGLRIYEDAGTAKIGTKNDSGYIVTKTIDLSGNSGNSTIQMLAMKYEHANEKSVVQILHSADGINFTQIGSNISLTNTFTTYFINFSGGTANSKIKITGAFRNFCRYLLDSIVVYQMSIQLPTITTLAVSSITYQSAICGGNVTSNGYALLTARGLCWSTSHNPTISNNKTNEGTDIGSFIDTLTDLNPSTTYYIRAYATNSVGTAYGDEVSFTTDAEPANSPYSDIVANSQFVYSSNINYISNLGSVVNTTNVELFRFDIRDGGSKVDNDALQTTLNSITFNIENYQNLNKIALYEGSTKIAETSASSSISFTSLNISASDGTSKTLSLRANFANSVCDNVQLKITVSSATTSANSSTFAKTDAGGAMSSITADNNRIEVTASKFVFTTQPFATAYTNIALSTQPVVSAIDDYNNKDLDFNGLVTLTNSGSLPMSNNAKNAFNGVVEFQGFSINNSGNVTISATGALSAAVSNLVVVTTATFTGSVKTSVSSLYSFGNCYLDFLSDAQYFKISATGISHDATIKAPKNFLVSLNFRTGFSPSISVVKSNSSIPYTKIFVRYQPTAIGSNSDTIKIYGGTSIVNVLVSGKCVESYIPTNYYVLATGTGANLKTQLFNIINSHTQRTYDNLWTDFGTTDRKFDGSIWDMYSDKPGDSTYVFGYQLNQCATTPGYEAACYNREHSFCKSWFGGEQDPMYTDLFHIVPTDSYVNSRRNNHMYGIVSNPTYTSINGGKLGNCTYPGYAGTDLVVFEPIDEYKGDLARNYFYMVTCYENEVETWKYWDTDDVRLLNATKYPAFTSWALNMLLEWNEFDPVSQKEINRNQAVYKIQGNRNPFIDNQNYANLIWKTATNVTSTQTENEFSLFPNPCSDFLYIKSNSNDEFYFQIINSKGQIILFSKKNIKITQINVNALYSGIYIVKIINNKHQYFYNLKKN